MLATVMTCFSACGNSDKNGADASVNNTAGNSSNNSSSNNDSSNDDSSNDSKSKSFSLKELKLSAPDSYKEKAAQDTLLAFGSNDATVTVAYEGETEYTSSKEATESAATSLKNYTPDAKVEIAEKNGITYIIVTGTETDGVSAYYVNNGKIWSVSSTKTTDEVINIVTSGKFN